MSDKNKYPEMGKLYWQIDNTADSYDTLHNFLTSWGLEEITPDSFKDKITGWKRKRMYTDGSITFITEWFINRATLKFGTGDWNDSLCDVEFERIYGSYLPYADHNTFKFACKKNEEWYDVCNLALIKKNIKEDF